MQVLQGHLYSLSLLQAAAVFARLWHVCHTRGPAARGEHSMRAHSASMHAAGPFHTQRCTGARGCLHAHPHSRTQLQDACFQYLHLRQLLLGPVGEQSPVGDLVGNNFFADIYPLFSEWRCSVSGGQ